MANDAIPVWSGFIYQGKIMLLCVLERLALLQKGTGNVGDYAVELERQEDFAFLQDNKTSELYQVKEWNCRAKWNRYRDVLEKLIQHKESSNNPDAKCFLVTAHEVDDWENIETKFKGIILYQYDEHNIDGLKVIDYIHSEIQKLLLSLGLDESKCEQVYCKLCVYIEHKVLEIHQEDSLKRNYTIPFSCFLNVIYDSISESTIDSEFISKEQAYIQMWKSILVPANYKILEKFQDVIDTKMHFMYRSINIYQYCEFIVDIFLKDIIQQRLEVPESYKTLELPTKTTIVQRDYDEEIGKILEKVIALRNKAMKYSKIITDAEFGDVIDDVKHIIERLFIKYFSMATHKFGNEKPVTSAFSFLPLEHRIYILENLPRHKLTPTAIYKLALAYVKNNEPKKGIDLLRQKYQGKELNRKQYTECMAGVFVWLEENESARDYFDARCLVSTMDVLLVIDRAIKVKVIHSSVNSFDAEEQFKRLAEIFEKDYETYPQFFNMFLCLLNINGGAIIHYDNEDIETDAIL